MLTEEEDCGNMPCSQGSLFCYSLTKDYENACLPKVEVVLYKAKDLYDDRYKHIEAGSLQPTHSNAIVFNLALAQAWNSKDSKIETNDQCCESCFIKQAFLKPGSYVYLYRVDGVFQLSDQDRVTVLGSKRKVHYVDVRGKHQESNPTNDFNKLEATPILTKEHNKNTSSSATVLSADTLRAFSSIRDFYQVKMAMNGGRLQPLERAVWNRVLKKMAAKLNQQS